MFLDAIGEKPESNRRNSHRGIWTKTSYNKDIKGKEIDVFLLDERWDRDPLPCQTRRKWCEETVLIDALHNKHGWCTDFLYGGNDGKGSCCKKDEEVSY